MFTSLRTKIILSFILVVALIGAVNTFAGVKFIGGGIIKQAQNRVGADLNSAGEMYRQAGQKVLNVAHFTAMRLFIRDALLKKDREALIVELRRVQKLENIDFLSVTDSRGKVFARSTTAKNYGDDLSKNSVIKYVLENKKSVVSTELLTEDELLREDSGTAKLARIKIVPTPMAKFQRQGDETAGMIILAATPVFNEKDSMLGIVYSGKLINNNYEIVDKIKNTVFQAEKYKGKDIGTATIFLKDLRISTNVMNLDGTRAIGTLIAKDVYEAVLDRGESWIARAFVVNDWYITAYEPIRNINNEIIGVLYVGILERKYTDWRNQIVLIFIGITFLSMLIVFGLSYFLTTNITKPLSELATAAKNFAQGIFPEKVEIKTKDEIADFGKAFQFMITSLKERDEALKECATRTIAEAERLAMIGQLAAGVAHEINNPLTGILLYCDLLLKSIPKDSPQRTNLEKINSEALRCKTIIKGLLDFARQKKPEIKESSVNQLLESSLSLVKNQAIFLNIGIKKDLDPTLPFIKIDPSQIQQVFMNIVINAAEAMSGKGDLSITSRISEDKKFIEISFVDTGPGIKPEYLKRIFEPFFTTKEATHGVGLGLSISHRIIEDHNGKIKVASELGKGTAFTIELLI